MGSYRRSKTGHELIIVKAEHRYKSVPYPILSSLSYVVVIFHTTT